MYQLLNRLSNLGIPPTASPYVRRRLRFSNSLKLSVLVLYTVYLALGIACNSPFLETICTTLVLTAIGGLYLSYLRRYNLAFTLFLGGFNLTMLVCCNSMVNGSDFAIIFLSTLFLYGSFANEKHLPTLLLNLVISIGSFASLFLLPAHLWYRVSLPAGWVSFYHVFNYSFTFTVSLFFTLSIVRNQQKNARKLQLARLDAEQQKEAYLEERNRAEAATQAKSQFLSHMSHELRTPLNGIIGSVQLLLQEEIHSSQRNHFQVLQYSSEHMLRLINDVLDFSKIEAGVTELHPLSFNLQQTLYKLKAVHEGQFTERGLKMHFEVDKRLNRQFITDETRLIQVLSNLLSNALKFTRQGSVRLVVQLEAMNREAAQIYFAVIDTGIGISEMQLGKIFEAFRQAETSTTRNYGGTGLGLTISKELVTLMGGELKVDSHPGKGSQFYFTLDLPFGEEKAPKWDAPQALPNLRGIRILIADDSPVNRTIARSFLERWQAIVDEADNGREALELISANAYDLLLLDLHMPDMDGYEAIVEIRKMNPVIPAIAFTAALMKEIENKLLELGFNGFLQKPFRPEELFEKIASCLRIEV
jgi:signal transduction histidine kinase/CheY-like chemotaxis protein